MLRGRDLETALAGVLRPGETPLFGSSIVSGGSGSAPALSALARIPLLLGWRTPRARPAGSGSSFSLPAAGVVALTDTRLLVLSRGRRGARLSVQLGDLVVDVSRDHVSSVTSDNAGMGWQTLAFVLDDDRSLAVSVPPRDVGEWLEQFPSPDGVPFS